MSAHPFRVPVCHTTKQCAQSSPVCNDVNLPSLNQFVSMHIPYAIKIIPRVKLLCSTLGYYANKSLQYWYSQILNGPDFVPGEVQNGLFQDSRATLFEPPAVLATCIRGEVSTAQTI